MSRHGQSEYNALKLIGGDSSLTPEGIKYAHHLAAWVKQQKLDLPQKRTRLWLSTMKRTAQTIQFFPNTTVNNWEILRPKKWSCLDEIHAGQMDGFTYQDIKEVDTTELRGKVLVKFSVDENGKIVEVAVKNIIDGNKINNIEALSNPSALNEYKNLIELKS